MRADVLLLTLVVIASSVNETHAQRPYISLPPTHGATVLSTYIDAEARRIVATGIFLESAASARLTHMEADRLAIENSMLWLETYFERKKLNREYRRAQNPTYFEQQRRRDQVRERSVLDLPGEVMDGDVTDDLNWMLDRLLSEPRSHELIFADVMGDIDHLDKTLTPEEISHILLREATGTGSSGPMPLTLAVAV